MKYKNYIKLIFTIALLFSFGCSKNDVNVNRFRSGSTQETPPVVTTEPIATEVPSSPDTTPQEQEEKMDVIEEKEDLQNEPVETGPTAEQMEQRRKILIEKIREKANRCSNLIKSLSDQDLSHANLTITNAVREKIIEEQLEEKNNEDEQNIKEAQKSLNSVLYKAANITHESKPAGSKYLTKQAGVPGSGLIAAGIACTTALGVAYILSKVRSNDQAQKTARFLGSEEQKTARAEIDVKGKLGSKKLKLEAEQLKWQRQQLKKPKSKYRRKNGFSGNKELIIKSLFKDPNLQKNLESDMEKYKENTFIVIKKNSLLDNFINDAKILDDSMNDQFIDDINSIDTKDGYLFQVSKFIEIIKNQINDLDIFELVFRSLLSNEGKMDVNKINEYGKNIKVNDNALENKYCKVFKNYSGNQQILIDTIKKKSNLTEQYTSMINKTIKDCRSHLDNYKHLVLVNLENLKQYVIWVARLKCFKDKLLSIISNVFGEYIGIVGFGLIVVDLEEIKNVLEKVYQKNEINEEDTLKAIDDLEKTHNMGYNIMKPLLNKIKNDIREKYKNSKFTPAYSYVDGKLLIKKTPIDQEGSEDNSEDGITTDTEVNEYNNKIIAIRNLRKNIKDNIGKEDILEDFFEPSDYRILIQARKGIDITKQA